jgi:hypothetical protein
MSVVPIAKNTAGLRPPLVPEDCDLSGMQSMMLDVGRLRRSRLALTAKRRPEIGWISVLLWAAAWEETPPASLEDDDDVLADRAMLSPERWAELKPELLRPWVLCSNGRWYHPVVAEKANELWAARLRKRHELEYARERKAWKAASKPGDPPKTDFFEWLRANYPVTFAARTTVFEPIQGAVEAKSGSEDGGESHNKAPVTEPVTATATEQKTPEFALKVKQKVKVKQKGSVSTDVETGGAAAKPGQADAKAVLYAEGRRVLGSNAGGLITQLLVVCDQNVLKASYILGEAAGKGDPSSWLIASMRARGKPGQDTWGL